MSSLITCPFNFNDFKKIWNSGGLNEDIDVVGELVKNNPLLHETLLMQGHAMAVMDITTMTYPLLLGDVEKVCGWSTEFFYQTGVNGLLEKFLPEDLLGLGEISKQLSTYLPTLRVEQVKDFKAIYDYRIYREDGSTTRICQESTALKTNADGHIIYFMIYVSDITHFKREGKQHMHLMGGDTNLLAAIDNASGTIRPLTQLSKRELEIARLMGMGHTSEQIAEKLFITTNTVNTHRQNMLRKLELMDTTELMNFIKIYRLL
ncbi:helix-turn-helix transcriptional regulator [Emticicia agri]|uniref:LuxR family transcriptional regulator n=1 Tax=Emticicia agri TaxID=2492393 RepID=A0A4V1ZDR0_9BACT|nr:LuxR C-terminal-related transcriptional regulator [Emticicia agri]RYU97030.1 LuxR family transcriptional regulator [Emticicia agri]